MLHRLAACWDTIESLPDEIIYIATLPKIATLLKRGTFPKSATLSKIATLLKIVALPKRGTLPKSGSCTNVMNVTGKAVVRRMRNDP